MGDWLLTTKAWSRRALSAAVGYAVVEEFPIDARTDYWLEKSLPAASVS